MLDRYILEARKSQEPVKDPNFNGPVQQTLFFEISFLNKLEPLFLWEIQAYVSPDRNTYDCGKASQRCLPDNMRVVSKAELARVSPDGRGIKSLRSLGSSYSYKGTEGIQHAKSTLMSGVALVHSLKYLEKDW